MYRECQGNEDDCACAFQSDITDENGDEVFGCPWKRIPDIEFCERFIRWYQAYKGGYLLYAGGFGEQPEWYTQGILAIDGEQNRIDALASEASRKELERQYSK